MATDVLDRFYDSMQNVVLRDVNGYPSVFVKHYKVNSSFLDPSLPDHAHPAFTYSDGGEDDAILIGKYHSSSLAQGGALYSLPNAVPDTYSSMVVKQDRIRMTGNQTCLTICDFGYMFLLANKWCKEHGAKSPCTGNFYNGGDGTLYNEWKEGNAIVAGDVVCYAGWSYKCLQDHTAATTILPDRSLLYWEKIAKIGGTCVPEDWELDGGLFFNDAVSKGTFGYRVGRTLTGSGPINWYFGHDICNEADWLGNINMPIAGLRFYQGEMQVMPYNDAGDPNVPYSFANSSTSWKAILPSGSDSSYTYVNPGTTGTLRMSYSGGKLVWTTAPMSGTTISVAVDLASKVTYDPEAFAVPPSILYELGLLPIPGQPITYQIFFMVSNDYRYCSWRQERSTTNHYGILHVNSASSSPSTPGVTTQGVRNRARFITT